MKDYLIIRVNREAFNNHSLEETGVRRYKNAIKKIKELADGLGLAFLITVNTSINWLSYDSLVDVYCTKELSQENKQMIAEQLKEFMKDRPAFSTNGNKLYQIGYQVFFHKFDANDVIEITGDQEE